MILKALGSNNACECRAAAEGASAEVQPVRRRERSGAHIDNAMMDIPGSGGLRMRADLSMTVFFSEPEEYDGGELRVLDTYGHQAIKLPAGHAILYTATSLHEVTPVTRGIRTSSFFWIQSMIRDDVRRSILFDLGKTIDSLVASHPDHPSVAEFLGHYHKLAAALVGTVNWQAGLRV